ncbi:MAG: uracil-DNA glycosylase [Candidatus Paceibacterota bacterium]
MERGGKERYILGMEISEKEKQERYEAMKKIRDEVINLKESPLYATRVKPVIGEGSHFSKIMFIGEAPGKNEAETGRPFCGAAGKILDELLESAGIKREEVYITNIVKDRPPNNRDPLPEEIRLYAPFLDRQVEIIKPEIIATLGRYSMVYIMERYGLAEMVEPISKARGKVYETIMPYGTVKIAPLYHPAVAVYNRTMIEALKEDFKVLKELV